LWPRYHPTPPTITRPAIATEIRIDLRQEAGGVGGPGIGGLSGGAKAFASVTGELFITALTVFARVSKWRSSGGEKASIHCEVEMKYSSDLAGGMSSTRNGMI
jgi:hypothetical protein